MTKIVMISGKMGSGKTTLSRRLIWDLHLRKNSRALNIKFADPLYAMHDFCLGVIKQGGIEREVKKDGALLQMLGTDWGRKIDQNIWVKLLLREIKVQEERLGSAFPSLYVVIDDLRFKNELESLPCALRVRLECFRDERKRRCEGWRDNETHASETDLDEWVVEPGKFDMVFDTALQTPEHCSALILAQLDKNVWLEKREANNVPG